ncbi:hypothetical protein J1N35_041376 [Gossypium stocksii]|uniref:Uncharacterized protein n=1 Tax=Gossypium stocksii TaxID=47602 RepID=A0A9D3UFW1_9ROSI|nr:hypothetical protein J1N35_041376 [Gossypium stocksii]
MSATVTGHRRQQPLPCSWQGQRRCTCHNGGEPLIAISMKGGADLGQSAVTGSVQSANWGIVCYELLVVVQEMITRDRIELVCLQNNFVELAVDSTEEKRV